MRFAAPLTPGRLIRRYKRFLADVVVDDGTQVTCHCPNTGSMLGCADPGSRVWLSRSDNAKRKYSWTWEQVETAAGVRVGIHTGRTNALVAEALAAEWLPELADYAKVRAEVSVPEAPMRADFVLEAHDWAPPCYLEVKNVTAAGGVDGVALFPDAVTARGTRHLQVLTELRERGLRSALVFCAQRGDAREVRPADHIDPGYGVALRRAIAAGVDVYAVGARVGPDGIDLDRRLPVVCPDL